MTLILPMPESTVAQLIAPRGRGARSAGDDVAEQFASALSALLAGLTGRPAPDPGAAGTAEAGDAGLAVAGVNAAASGASPTTDAAGSATAPGLAGLTPLAEGGGTPADGLAVAATAVAGAGSEAAAKPESGPFAAEASSPAGVISAGEAPAEASTIQAGLASVEEPAAGASAQPIEAPEGADDAEAPEATTPDTPATHGSPAAPTPRASSRALEALTTIASPRAAEHAAPVRASDATAPAHTPSGEPAPAAGPHDGTATADPVGPVGAVTPGSGRAAEVHAPQASAHATAPEEVRSLPPHQQIVSTLSPLRRGPDGSYRLTVQLHPQELGRVRLEVELHGGDLSVHLHAEDDVAQATLRESLPAMRAELEASGFGSSTLDVGGWGQAQSDGRPGERGTPGSGASTVSVAPTAPLPPLPGVSADDGTVDIRV